MLDFYSRSFHCIDNGKKKVMSKKPISIRIDETLLNDMQEVSKIENRSVTNLIETVMRDYCITKLPPKSGKERRVKKKK